MPRFRPFLALALLAVAASPARAKLYAAAGKVEITPDPVRETVWLAGFGARGRRAEGARDALHARAVLVSDGHRTVALVSVDSIGLYREEVRAIRGELGWTGADKYLLAAATHDHSAPDTLGLWGRFPGVSGVDARYQARVRQAVAGLVRDLSDRLEPAELWAARADVDPRGLCRDSRDPVVIDPELNALQLRRPGGRAIGTLVRWSCHAEAVGRENRLLTADYPGFLCAEVEKRTGGACAFFPGSIGGLMTPDETVGARGGEYGEARRIGEAVASQALRALGKAERLRPEAVSFESRAVRLPVENSLYLVFLRSLTFGHRVYDAAGRELSRWRIYWLSLRHLLFFPLPDDLRPWVDTEVSLVKLGPARLLGIPGELFPELALGGYDGSRRFGYPLVAPANPNPPDLARAPKGPYLREKLKAKHGLILGLANDEIGYIVPPYDFQATPRRFMRPRPPGTHYEETNSIGPSATYLVLESAGWLIDGFPSRTSPAAARR